MNKERLKAWLLRLDRVGLRQALAARGIDKTWLKKWPVRIVLGATLLFILAFVWVAISDVKRDQALKNRKPNVQTAAKVVTNAAERAVGIYEASKNPADLRKAQSAVDKLTDEAEKQAYQARINAVSEAIHQADAQAAVEAMEASPTLANIQNAQTKVALLIDEALKAAHSERIHAAVGGLAEQALQALETTGSEGQLATMQAFLPLIADEAVRADYTARTQAVMVRMANWYLQQLKKSPTNLNYDAAVKAVTRLDEGETKGQLQTQLNGFLVVVADAHVVALEFYKQANYVASAQTAVARLPEDATKWGYQTRINRVLAQLPPASTPAPSGR